MKLPDAAERAGLRDRLIAAGGESVPVSGTGEEWRVRFAGATKKDRAQVTAWRTGTVRLDGKGEPYERAAGLLGVQVSGPSSATRASGGERTDPLAERPPGPWIGTDESGKGDYFGPLVSAAVLVDEIIAMQLEDLGVTDSKKLTDKRVRGLAPQIRALVEASKLTPLPPSTYNRLYERFRSEGKGLNQLLAWGHARSIEDLLAAGAHPAYAIVDQFADARVIERGLLAGTRERGLRVFQFPRAEADLAVAAASILAREAFLDWMDRATKRLGFPLPKGAGPQVIDAGRRIVAERGDAALADYAKIRFKTTQQVLGQGPAS